MKELLFGLFILLVNLPMALSQDIKISGKVTSGSDELPGVNIIIKGTTIGTVTDKEGNYAISVTDTSTVLIYSFVGFATQEIKVGYLQAINVVLEYDFLQLSEMVVIGYGEQKKSVSTGAIASVGKEKLEGLNFRSAEQTLVGQVSGVYVAPSSGQPGSAQTIVIRGVGTNGNNNPLYVVDGMVTDDISHINPSDIESMEVLKDAASTAIYGARGANGVIILTTQKGASDKVSLEYTGFVSSAKPWRLPTMMNSDQYVKAINEKFSNTNPPSVPVTGFPQPGDSYINTNWMEEVVSSATTINHNLSLSKLGETGHYFFSIGYWNQEGVIGEDKSNFKRYTARINSKSIINKFLLIGENLSFIHSEQKTIPENNAFGSVLVDAFNTDPLTPIHTDYNDSTYGFFISPFVGKEYVNPFARLFITNNFSRTDRVQGNVFAEISPIKDLKLRSDFGIDYQYGYNRTFTPTYYFRSDFNNVNNMASQGFSSEFTWRWENYVSYSKEINGHNINIVVGLSAREKNGDFAGGSRQNIPNSQQFNQNWWYINAGVDTTDQNYGSALVREAIQSYFGRVLYNFNEKYLVTASIRRDGSSKFGLNNRFGIFPSFSAGWVLSEENFFNFPFINFAKLRASWGINGNDRIGNLAYTSIVSNNRYTYQFGKPGNETQYFGEAPVAISNPNIKWEESVQWDIGLELDFLDGKLSTDIDFYKKRTQDLLMRGVIPGLVGNNAPILNTGEIINKGLEVSINYNDNWNGLRFSGGLNFSTNNNEVTQVAGDGENPFIEGYSWPVKNFTITRMTLGQPISHFRGYKTDGVFASQNEVFAYINNDGDPIQPGAQAGDIKFVDVNGDGEITEEDITTIGKPWADVILGVNLNLGYRGFDLRMLINANIGHEVYKVYERQDVVYNNYQDTWLDRWSETNPTGKYPRLVLNDVNKNQRPSDFYVEDASFVRIRVLQVGYNLSSKILKKLLLQKLRVYVSFDNLLTLTKYTGFDPEIGSTGWILDTGIDKGFYPQNKSIGAGINISF